MLRSVPMKKPSILSITLGLSADYLMSGSMEDSAAQSISDKTLLDQFKKVEQLPDNMKLLVKEFLDAFLTKADLRENWLLSLFLVNSYFFYINEFITDFVKLCQYN